MPIYEYDCPGCGQQFEELVSSAATEVTCPSCGAAHPRRRLSTFVGKMGQGQHPAPAACPNAERCGGACPHA